MATYGIVCASYISFYFRIKSAANDLTLENRAAFNRDDDLYPYRTSGQLFRAVYGVGFCFLLILFNGWQSFLTPFSSNDFIASYISVVVFFVVISLYHIKSDGWNPWNWRWSPSMQIQRPPPMVVAGRRRGILQFPNRKRPFSSENFAAILDWIWVWLK
jgi:amino acid permease